MLVGADDTDSDSDDAVKKTTINGAAGSKADTDEDA